MPRATFSRRFLPRFRVVDGRSAHVGLGAALALCAALGARSFAQAPPARESDATAAFAELGAPGARGEQRAAPRPQAEDELAAARAEADRKRRRGDRSGARRDLAELLDEDPADVAARALLARVHMEEGSWDKAARELARALEHDSAKPEDARLAARVAVELGLVRGDRNAATEAAKRLADSDDPRDAWWLGRLQRELGAIEPAQQAFTRGANAAVGDDWERGLAKARCQRALGMLGRASETLVAALDASEAAEHVEEPELLVELASLYFEADGEVDHAQTKRRSPVPLLERALALDAGSEAAKLALFEVYRFNWVRQRRNAADILNGVLAANPRSIEGLLAALSADLDDGQLVAARARLAELEKLAPGRREVRSERAALAWIEHEREDARALLESLATENPRDARPERIVGEHLNELYRFAEAVPFLKAAVERDPGDWRAWTQYGRALANTGDEKTALEALQRAEEVAAGRADAWRNNTRIVLAKLARDYGTEKHGELSFAWTPTPAPVFRTYWIPFYADERAELARRYGFTPSPTHIEVFDTWADFSVRSTGFEGFPALGVCFGPVVTAVSPISELRGNFSWARTAFHEFTHVIHLGLSHNRCPRWITEGLATWEEENKHRHWTRNMRRELVDALANDDVIRVRDLNRAFRGPRILFGYYQSGLVCRMWIEQYGFQSLVRLLEAFDRGADLDQALDQVFDITPEEADRDFDAFVKQHLAGIAIEPRWSDGKLARIRIARSGAAPQDPAERRAWADELCSLAWGEWQRGRRLDAENVLRRVDQAQLAPARASFLRGEIALSRDLDDTAREFYRAGLAQGGEDFRVRMALGKTALQRGEHEEAEKQFLAAEACFPGYPERELAAEVGLAELYTTLDRKADARRALERWLGWNDDYGFALELARWHAQEQRFADADRWFRRALEIDPFRRKLHVEWAEALEALGDFAGAAREWRVAAEVADATDADQPGPLAAEEHARFLGRAAQALVKAGKTDEAVALAERALALDPDCEEARSIVGN
ncbi:MAG: tetratricopeptide repeat protein [Planctomycetes bacterium]|nr:tetratricopeptide repeat protein [Planctomycetota bacterium]